MLARALPLALACLAALAPAAGAAERAPARAVLAACERATDEADGAGVFEGQMRAAAGSARLQMRFTLQARTPARPRWTTVQAPGFGAWATSAAGTARYVYTKRVEGLLAPGAYRVRVRFRWLDAGGVAILRASAFSAACRQPDTRPDLVVRSIALAAGARPGRQRYVVKVRNTGRTTAGASSLELTVGGEMVPAASVAALDAGESALVELEGPACAAGEPLTAEADAAQAVDERNEADNVFSRPCPGAF